MGAGALNEVDEKLLELSARLDSETQKNRMLIQQVLELLKRQAEEIRRLKQDSRNAA